MDTEEAQQQALTLFSQLQPESPEPNKRTLYVLDYAKGAYVWTENWHAGGRSLGFWPLQQRVSMLETLQNSTSSHFKDMRKLQRAQQQRLRMQAEAVPQFRCAAISSASVSPSLSTSIPFRTGYCAFVPKSQGSSAPAVPSTSTFQFA